MGRSARNRKVIAKLGPSPAEIEFSKTLDKLETNPEEHSFLCVPSTYPFIERLDGGIDGPCNERILRIPAFGRLFEGKGAYKYDAFERHIWLEESCKLAASVLTISDDRYKAGKDKASRIFFQGGKLCEDTERYIPYFNDAICKHFVSECIHRVLQTMHCPHEQKIAAVGLMFATWFQPKE